MTAILDETSGAIARVVRSEREERGWSLTELAQRSGVSRAMISTVERGEANPTATLLGRLSGAFGLTLSQLVARAEDRTGAADRLVRSQDQPVWTDPVTGYERRAISPAGGALELVEVRLPPGREVSYPASAYAFIHQQIWVLEGELAFTEGPDEHRLGAGDCLRLGEAAACTFANRGRRSCRYLVAVARR